MNEEFFSFKTIVHELQLCFPLVFIDETYQKISNPAFLLKILDFPLIMINGKGEINRNTEPKKIFCTGSGTVFKYQEAELKDKLAENPMKVVFSDLETPVSEGKIKKIIAKCNISLGIFIEELERIFNNNEENFKRHCFKLFDEKREVVALADISISLVKRSITYLNRTISQKLENHISTENNENRAPGQKPEERTTNQRFFDTFGRNGPNKNEEQTTKLTLTAKSGLPFQNTQKLTKTVEVQTGVPVYPEKATPNLENKEAKMEKTLPKSVHLVNPSLKFMVEGCFCPPPMILVKRSATPNPPPSRLNNYASEVPVTQPPQMNPKTIEFFSSFQIQEQHPPTTTGIPPLMNKEPFSSPFQKRPDSVLDQLIEELLYLRNIKQKSPNVSPQRISKTPGLGSERDRKKSSVIERKSQRMSMRDLEKTPQQLHTQISEDYPEDFESVSLSPSHLVKSTRKSNIVNNSNRNFERAGEYSEDFESYTISDTKERIEKVRLEKSLSDSNSQSNSQKKMVSCFICGKQVETSKATEHAKICKSSNLRYSQKKQDKITISNSFKSIEEEEELAQQKENVPSNKQSLIRESNKSEEYIEDFHSSAAEEEKF